MNLVLHCNLTLNEQVNQIILRSLTTFTRQQFDAQEVIINSLKKQLEKSQSGKNNFDTKLLSIEENVNALFNWCPISLSNVRLKNGTCYVFLEGGNSFESATSKCANFTKSINMTTLVSIYLLSVGLWTIKTKHNLNDLSVYFINKIETPKPTLHLLQI